MNRNILFIISMMMIMTIGQVDAKRFGGGGGFRSTSSSFRIKSHTIKPNKPKQPNTNKPFLNKVGKDSNKNVLGAKKSAKPVKLNKFEKQQGIRHKAKLNKQKKFEAYSQKFKKSPKKQPTIAETRERYRDNKFVNNNVSRYDNTTYSTRRSNYYDSYNPPVYVYDSSPSFGMWDSMALWYMLDNINDSKYRELAYHHQNDTGFIAWRAEANRLAADNAQLNARLSAMDSYVTGMAGTPINNQYIPKGVDGDLLLAQHVVNSIKPTANIYTGSNLGSYSAFGHKMQQLLTTQYGYNVNVIYTNGSNDNVVRGSKDELAISLVQRNVFDVFTMCSNGNTEMKEVCAERKIDYLSNTKLPFVKTGTLFSDNILGLCNGVDYLSDATTIFTIAGGGDNITFSDFVIEFPHLGDIRTVSSKGLKTQLHNVSTTPKSCGLFIVKVGSPIIKQMNNQFATNKDLRIINIKHPKLLDIVAPTGEQVYNVTSISTSKLGKVSEPLAEGILRKHIETLSVPVDVIVQSKTSNKFKDDVTKVIQQLKHGK